MTWLDAIPVFIAGIILGPIIYAVDDWSRPKFYAWIVQRWKQICFIVCGFVLGAFCMSAFNQEDHSKEWNFGWDALVAIGTIGLAAVTAALVIAPSVTEKKRLSEKVAFLAIAIDFELSILQTTLIEWARMTVPSSQDDADILKAMHRVVGHDARLKTPVVEKLLLELHHLPFNAANAVVIVFQGILGAQIRLTKKNIDDAKPEERTSLLKTLHGHALTLMYATYRARQWVRPLTKGFALKLSPLKDLPADLKKEYEESDSFKKAQQQSADVAA